MASEESKKAEIALAEEIWLTYFNNYLYDHGVITETERNRMFGMEEIRSTLAKAQADASHELITPDFVGRYIDRVFVTPTNSGEARLDIKIFTGTNCEKYLRKIEARSAQNGDDTKVPVGAVSMGHMSKKMIESYENNIKG